MKFNKISVFLVLFIAIFSTFFYSRIQNNKKDSDKSRMVLKLNTSGLGQVSYYIDEDNKIEFDDEYPNQSTYTTFEGTVTVTIDAKADEGWKFIKWTKDEKDYSKDSKLDITISEDTELVAVFDMN